jgi:hypothetical protein
LRPKPRRVLIHDEADIGLLLRYKAFLAQAEVIRNQIEADIATANGVYSGVAQPQKEKSLLPTENLDIELKGILPKELLPKSKIPQVKELVGGTAIALAGATAKTAIDLISLFRTDVSLRYGNLTISDQALITAVLKELAAQNIEVYDPSLVPPDMMSQESKVQDELRQIDQAQQRLEGLHGMINADRSALAKKIEQISSDNAAADKGKTGGAETPEDKLQAVKDRLAALDREDQRRSATTSAIAAFRTGLIKADDNSGITALTNILHGENIASVATDAHWLWLKVAAAGGGYQTRQTLWGILTNVSYSGGAIVEFQLFDKDGKVVAAGLLPAYTGFIKLKNGGKDTAAIANVEL